MGLFTKLCIKPEYRTRRDIVIDDFYIPCLKEAVEYKRSVGFFSSNILVMMAEGLCSFAQRRKKIKLIVSTRIDKEDFEAMDKGYKLKEMNIQNKLLDTFNSDFDEYSKNRLSLLAYLISIDCLEVKMAFLKTNNAVAMYHEKLGIMTDSIGNIVAFSGSSNETGNAVDHDNGNYETIDVFKSWDSDFRRCVDKESAFDRIWEGKDEAIITMDFPKVVKEKLISYKPKTDKEVEIVVNLDNIIQKEVPKLKENVPSLRNINLHNYQKEAIDEWQKKDYKGIFDMATGTGKTFTGCGAICRIFEDKKKVGVIIVCPYTHLVEQWAEEVENFGIKPILAYSKTDWQKKFYRAVSNYRLGINKFFCVITTNVTYCTEKFQNNINNIADEILLIVDEAHNFGAMHLSKYLREDIKYRLALSATLDRYMDDVGTEKLYNYFGNKCITFTLSQAIGKYLTNYYYYPVPVYLSDGELEKYQELSKKISDECVKHGINENDRGNISDRIKQLLIKRAKIVAGCINKLDALKEKIAKYKEDSHILVYCGATTINDYGFSDNDENQEEIRQIDEVIKILGGEMNMDVSPFTSNEDSIARANIKESFKEGRIKVLVAIKCLDEGVNIPAIKTAFILASSTNPKEYIQRRGRVLRTFEGKKYAEIYDFITLPRNLKSVGTISNKITDLEISLIKREVTRMMDFASLAMNSIDSYKLKDQIDNAYKLNILEGGIDNE